MKSTLLAIALVATGFAAVPALSHAADTNTSGAFINGNVGESNLSNGAYDDSDTGFAGNIGYRWAVAPGVLLGVEGGYTDLGSIAPKNAYSAFPNAKITGWNAGVNGHFNVSDTGMSAVARPVPRRREGSVDCCRWRHSGSGRRPAQVLRWRRIRLRLQQQRQRRSQLRLLQSRRRRCQVQSEPGFGQCGIPLLIRIE